MIVGLADLSHASSCQLWSGPPPPDSSVQIILDRLFSRESPLVGAWDGGVSYPTTLFPIPGFPLFGQGHDYVLISRDDCLRYCRLDSQNKVVQFAWAELHEDHVTVQDWLGARDIGAISVRDDEITLPTSAIMQHPEHPSALTKTASWPQECNPSFDSAFSVQLNDMSPARFVSGLTISLIRADSAHGKAFVAIDDDGVLMPMDARVTLSLGQPFDIDKPPSAHSRVTLLNLFPAAPGAPGQPPMHPFGYVRVEIKYDR